MIDAPAIIEPKHRTETPNAPVPLGRASLHLRQGPDELPPIDVQLEAKWLPFPCVEFVVPSHLLHLGAVTLQSSAPKVQGDFRVVRTASSGSVVRAMAELVIVNHSASDSPSIASALIHLPNLPFVLGQPVKQGQSWYAGRQSFSFAEWRLIMDPIPVNRELVSETQACRGHMFTHVIEARKADGKTFRVKHVKSLLDDLYVALSLAVGDRIGSMLATCFDRSGNTAVEVFQPGGSGGWRELPGVAPLQSGVGPMLEAVGHALTHSRSADIVREATYWYLESAWSMVNSSVVLAQATMERLAFDYLVNVSGMLTREGYDRLTAQDVLRLFMHTLRIPTSKPEDAQSWRKHLPNDKSEQDTPALITLVRNAQVHPSSNAKDPARSTEVLLWARTRALETVELSLLRLVEYSGAYHPKDAGTRMTERAVPWAS